MKYRQVLMIFALLVVLAACSQKGIPDAKNWPIEEFSSITQDNESLGLEDLQGKVWVANFIFTNCNSICMPMTFNMAKLQEMVKEEGLENVEFVSFSVDPEVDNPEALKKYGEHFNVDFSNFNFLTGYSQAYIERFAYDNFKTPVKKPENEDQVIHQSYFHLVDQNGKIMKSYPGTNDIPFDEIIAHINALQ